MATMIPVMWGNSRPPARGSSTGSCSRRQSRTHDPGDSNALFDRMAVAYGLTYPLPELDRYVLPKDAPDQTPILVREKVRDRDELYAK